MHVLAQYASSSDFDWTPFIVVWLIFGVIGAAVGASKNMGCAGFLLGLLLGPIGIVIVAVSDGGGKLAKIQAKPDSEGWHPDPLGKFDARWYDGNKWTQHVGRIEPDGTRRMFEDVD